MPSPAVAEHAMDTVQAGANAPARRRYRTVRREFLLFVADLLVATGSMGAALWLRFGGDIPYQHLILYLNYLPLIVGIRLASASAFHLYDFRHRLLATDHVFGAIASATVGVAIGYAALAIIQLYYDPETQLSRLVGVIDWAILLAWFALSRVALLQWLTHSGYRVRLGLVGPVEACRQLTAELRTYAPRLIEISGVIGLDEEDSGEDYLGNAAALDEIVAENRIDQIIVVQVDLPQQALRDLLVQGDRSGADLYLYPNLGLSVFANTEVMSIVGLPVISLNPANADSPYGWGKPLLDTVVAAALLIITAPITFITAIAIKTSSPGPVFFSQERLGLHGNPFRIYKFRTMVADAELHSGPVLATKNDIRITPAGRLLRRMRIDEIPQLWNVLRGDMSLVGPRPERADFIARFTEETPLYERRFLVKPGLTGLAQIHGRYDTDYAQKLRYDLIYINTLSLQTDLRILVATIRTVLTARGAV